MSVQSRLAGVTELKQAGKAVTQQDYLRIGLFALRLELPGKNKFDFFGSKRLVIQEGFGKSVVVAGMLVENLPSARKGLLRK